MVNTGNGLGSIGSDKAIMVSKGLLHGDRCGGDRDVRLVTEKLLRRTLNLVPGYILGSNSIAGLLTDRRSSIPLSSSHFISEYTVRFHCSFDHVISIFVFDPHSFRPFIILLTHPPFIPTSFILTLLLLLFTHDELFCHFLLC
jgi:hypothetical protein